MTPEERETLVAYVTEVERILTVQALRFASLKALLVRKGLLTADEIEEAMKMVDAALAVEEALGSRTDALDRLRNWIEEQK